MIECDVCWSVFRKSTNMLKDCQITGFRSDSITVLVDNRDITDEVKQPESRN